MASSTPRWSWDPAHIPDWRRPARDSPRAEAGGVFYFAEPSYGRIHRGMYFLLGHVRTPAHADELRAALADAGLRPDECFHRTRSGTGGIARRAGGEASEAGIRKRSMFVPRNLEDLKRMVQERLEETTRLDFKRQFPEARQER